MKKLYPVVLLFIIAGMIACEAPANDKASQITGVWAYEKWELNGEEVAVDALEKPTMTFEESGVYMLKAGEAVRKSNWQLSGDTILVTAESGSDDQHKMVIVSLEGEKLVLESDNAGLKTRITLKQVD